MNLKSIFYTLVLLTINLSVFAQEPKLTIALLENDDIAEVNVNQDDFVEYTGKLTDVAETIFSDIEKEQKIAILVVNHKVGKPTIEVYASPELSEEKETLFLTTIDSLSVENTKLVDFPMLILLNTDFFSIDKGFEELILPKDRRKNEYKEADLKTKYELNKSFAVEVLSILGAYEKKVNKQFEGVKKFGKLISSTDFKENQNIAELVDNNYNYWRAIMEMSPGNQLIPITKIFILVSNGEFDYAMKYIEIISMYSDPSTISSKYLSMIYKRINIFNKSLYKTLNKGIKYHDKSEYTEAIDIYNTILESYPNSAWTKYELYYSKNALDLKNDKIDINYREDWDKVKIAIYKNNPMYHMDIRASNGKEGYLLFRRFEMNELFKNRDNTAEDIYEYANIAMDLGVYDFAADLFWISFTFTKKNDKALYRFLYCLEKLEVTDLKDNFKGNFEKEFSKIEKNKQKEMTKSSIYKSFIN